MANEKRLISFGDAIKATYEELYWNESTAAAVRAFLIKQPRVDAVEVVHGRWIISSDGYYPYCSECKEEPKHGEMTNYCPNCGAKIDGGNNDGRKFIARTSI